MLENFSLQTYAITETINQICEAYKCKPIEGMLSHQLKQFKIDGDKTIIQNPNDAQKKEHEKFKIEVHEVKFCNVSYLLLLWVNTLFNQQGVWR